ncbi:LysE family translocator [Pseudomonas putida]|uniref:LysE family translocator n=1 Tax=Pseudomonas putida TaxID=303 RepID=UPI002363E907|nr:LysE family translocator [Pseudomonas putida]MDD2004104.1 LysE family translocator [Pseudomonas putida]
MALHDWLAFTLVAMVVCLTPGPGIVMTLSNSVAYGPWRAMIGSVGNALGLLFVSTTTSAGLGALLQASSTAFLVLKVLGASYLVFLGVKQWRSRTSAFDKVTTHAPSTASAIKLITNGVTVAVTNPKAILFFAAFLPQFIKESGSQSQLAILVLTFAVCSVMAHFAYVMFAQALKKQLCMPGRARFMNRIFGLSFIGLGASLFTLRANAG